MSSVLFDPSFRHATLFGLVSDDETVATGVAATRKPINKAKKKVVEEMVYEGLKASPHSMKLNNIEQVGSTECRSREFRKRAQPFANPNLKLLFHGTQEKNHATIFEEGFLLDPDHWGDTDKGFIGQGVYTSPLPEYSAAYIKKTEGITRFAYTDPVALGTKFALLGCVVVTGRTRYLSKKEYGTEIDGYDSHTSWVTANGDPTEEIAEERFAKEYAIKEVAGVYARYVITLTRVNKETIWFDPNIENGENAQHRLDLERLNGFALYAVSDQAKALAVMKRKKKETSYRIVTAGRDGEEFVRKIRAAGITDRVLVFCMNVKYHQSWAKKFSDVLVTNTTSQMKAFASWQN